MKKSKHVIILVSVSLMLMNYAVACTTFCFMNNGEWIYGRNYDWYTEHCLVMVNKRGVAKTAITRDNPAQWVSKYGSVTFNQYGREFPLGGTNEAGLVVEMMWLDQTEYPESDSRKGLSALQWIQYQLDNFSTVDEVIATDDAVRITQRSAPLHFLVCDRVGKAATIEFLDGRMVVHTGSDLPVSALANSTYASSLRLYEVFDGDEAKELYQSADMSLKRFVWAASGVEQWDPETGDSPVDYAFSILDRVTVDFTMFSIVYHVGEGRIHYRSHSNADVRYIDCSKFDYSCDAPVKILDIAVGSAGDVTDKFLDYTYEANYDLISKSYSDTEFLRGTPDSVRQRVARYPENQRCSE